MLGPPPSEAGPSQIFEDPTPSGSTPGGATAEGPRRSGRERNVPRRPGGWGRAGAEGPELALARTTRGKAGEAC